jgi:hypothetical protein
MAEHMYYVPENKVKDKKSLKTRKDVADFWKIPHIISVDDVEAWEISFEKLYLATILLDKMNADVLFLGKQKKELMTKIEDMECEISMYFSALQRVSLEFDLDIGDYILLDSK